MEHCRAGGAIRRHAATTSPLYVEPPGDEKYFPLCRGRRYCQMQLSGQVHKPDALNWEGPHSSRPDDKGKHCGRAFCFVSRWSEFHISIRRQANLRVIVVFVSPSRNTAGQYKQPSHDSFLPHILCSLNRQSSVGTVTRPRDGPRNRGSIAGCGKKNLSLLQDVQTGSVSLGTGTLPGGKVAGA